MRRHARGEPGYDVPIRRVAELVVELANVHMQRHGLTTGRDPAQHLRPDALRRFPVLNRDNPLPGPPDPNRWPGDRLCRVQRLAQPTHDSLIRVGAEGHEHLILRDAPHERQAERPLPCQPQQSLGLHGSSLPAERCRSGYVH